MSLHSYSSFFKNLWKFKLYFIIYVFLYFKLSISRDEGRGRVWPSPSRKTFLGFFCMHRAAVWLGSSGQHLWPAVDLDIIHDLPAVLATYFNTLGEPLCHFNSSFFSSFMLLFSLDSLFTLTYLSRIISEALSTQSECASLNNKNPCPEKGHFAAIHDMPLEKNCASYSLVADSFQNV